MSLLRAVSTAAAPDCTAALLAESCGLNRPTAWRLLNTLEAHSMVSCDRHTGHWSVGVAVVEIARSAGVEAIVESAHGALERLSLQTGETAALAVPGARGLTYVDEVAPSAIVAAMWQGRTVPLHATSTGKVLLAFGDPAAVERLSEVELRRFTPTTVVDLTQLLAELTQVRQRGFAVCRGEYEASAWGVSAPVLDANDRPVAVLSVWGPASRVTESRFAALGALACETAVHLLHK